jgi:geranylgeranyl diphosphate synthase, type II
VTFDLKQYLASHQALVEQRLDEMLTRDIKAPAVLVDAMRYSLLAPGKRLRPALVFMACQAAGGSDEQALTAACAIEMMHTYSLIHDDLPAMDDDDLRRGLPTCHKKYGEALAILAGDALLTLAFQVLAQHYPAKTAARCCLELAKGSGAGGMVGGQVDDLAWERGSATGPTIKDPLFPRVDLPRTLDVLDHIHFHKTGMLFIACVRMGVAAAQSESARGPEDELLAVLSNYARMLGMVFQITDDLIDVEGTVASTGKQVGKDASRGKLTFPGFLGVERSRQVATEWAERASANVRALGASAEPLAQLMEFILHRDR